MASADPNVSTNNIQRLRRVCDLAGISQAENKRVELNNIKQGIEISLRDFEQANSAEKTNNAIFSALHFTKATCDAFIGMAAALSSVEGVGKSDLPILRNLKGPVDQARVVKSLYSTMNVAVDIGFRKNLKENGDVLPKLAEMFKKGADLIPDRDARYLAKNMLGKAEIGIAATKNDSKRVVSKSKDYIRDLSKYSLDQLQSEHPSGVKAVKAYIDISKEAFAYDGELTKIADDLISRNDEADARLISSRMMFKRIASKLQKKIDEIDGILRACGDQKLSHPQT